MAFKTFSDKPFFEDILLGRVSENQPLRADDLALFVAAQGGRNNEKRRLALGIGMLARVPLRR